MKKLLLLSLMCSVLTLSVFANGQGEDSASTYPNGPVTIICPFSPGGGSDTVSRAIAEAAKVDFPKGLVVENKTGGGGSIGMSYGMHSKPDGYTIQMIAPELVLLPHSGTGGDIDYKKFIPIIFVNSAYSAITVSADSPYQTLDDLIEAGKTKELQIGNSGIGAVWHLAAAGFADATNIKVTHVPFDGAAPAITSLLGNHIDAVSVSYAEVKSQVDAGKLRSLAVLAPTRLADCPDIPTISELGYGDLAIAAWRGYAVPEGTDPAIVDYIEKSFLKATKSESFTTFMANTHNSIDILTGQDFTDRLDYEWTYFGQLMDSLGLSK